LRMKYRLLCVVIVCLMLLSSACAGIKDSLDADVSASPAPKPVLAEDVLKAYMEAVNQRDYEKMYDFISENSTLSKEDFLTRNKNIYEGIEAANISISISDSGGGQTIDYRTTMDTQAGQITFENTAVLAEYGGEYKLEWNSNLIFPNLNDDDKVRVSTTPGRRGSILDRNGKLLVGESDVYAVGFVPGKISPETREADIATVAEILDMPVEAINDKLSQAWVRDDLFVPLDKNISLADTQKKEQLLAIAGIMLNTVQDRVYMLGAAAAALTGYVHNINAEELDARAGQGYTAASKIGKIGLESLLEERIRGVDGCRIYIVDKDGQEKEVLAERSARDGEDVRLTIDSALQEKLYHQMKDDKAAAVVMQPNTGEILALVSTPSYDPNDFILGITEEKWAKYNDEALKPLFNRFKAAYVPGSSFKPITAALGLTSGAFATDEDFGPSGTTWKKDNWNNYNVTTLTRYSGAANVKNALIYSDNIYFAKAALKIGGSSFADGLKRLGFGQEVPFEFGLSSSTFGTALAFDDEIDVANSGYGQGKVQINPIHMASIYSAFVNGGDMMTPYLEKEKAPQVWKQDVFSGEAVQAVRSAMVQVIENPGGTGHSFKIDGLSIAGKTGTAEIKRSREDTQGTELGWFVAYPADTNQASQYLVVAMIEDVKGRGGSHYVVPIVRSIFAD
jgi:cell division protein FtsI/penicillin-binding protein 2